MFHLAHLSAAKTLDGNVAVKKKSLRDSFLLLTELHVISFPMGTKAMKTIVVCDLFAMYLSGFLGLHGAFTNIGGKGTETPESLARTLLSLTTTLTSCLTSPLNCLGTSCHYISAFPLLTLIRCKKELFCSKRNLNLK